MSRRTPTLSRTRELFLYAGIYIGFYVLMAGLFLSMFIQVGVDPQVLATPEGEGILLAARALSAAYLGAGSAVLAVWRLLNCHPTYNPRYMRWLQTTPWTHAAPLPSGSPLPGWPELIVLSLIAALSSLILEPSYMAWSLAPYGFAYAAFALWPLLHENDDSSHEHLAALLLLLGLPIVWPENPWVVMGASALMLAVAWHGVRRRLIDLPQYEKTAPSNVDRLNFIGLSSLEPAKIKRKNRWRESVVVCLVLGYWAGVINALVMPEAVPIELLILGLLCVGVVRLVGYVGNRMPPISLSDRVRLRRPIVPRYDVVFAAPLSALLLGTAIGLAGLFMPTIAPIATGTAVFIGMLILTKGGPGYSHWQLTSDHRVRLRTS